MAKGNYDRKDDVVISTVYLYTPDSVIDLLSGNFVKEVFVYENLMNTFYSGSITLVDTKAIFEALDMSENSEHRFQRTHRMVVGEWSNQTKRKTR